MANIQRIGMVVDTEFTNDPRVRNEAKILISGGFQVFVLAMNFGNYENDEVVDGAVVERIEMTRARKNKLYGTMNTVPKYITLWRDRIKAFVAKHDIQALHVHDLHMMEASHGAVGGQIPLVIDLHENMPALFETAFTWARKPPKKWIIRPGAWRKKEPKLLGWADRIIVLDRTYADQLAEDYTHLNRDHFVEYPNVPDVDQLLSYSDVTPEGIGQDDFTLFYFGIIAKRRGVFEVMGVLPELKQEIPNLKLLLIGPCDQADQEVFNNLLQQPGIKETVVHHTWKDINEFPSYCKASTVGISPIVKDAQHESGIANKVFQYMLFGKALLVSNCLPQQNLIEQYDCGLSYVWNDPEDLKAKIRTLYNDQSRTAAMGERGRTAVLNEYNSKKKGEDLIRLYRELL